MQTIKLKRGQEARRSQVLLKEGEPLITTDKKELWIGDGSTMGGWPVGTIKSTGNIQEGDVALFGADSRSLKSQTKADFLADYSTTNDIAASLLTEVPKIKVNSAVKADTATDAEQLGGVPAASYVDTSKVTENYQDGAPSKVVSAKGIKDMNDVLTKAITDGAALSIPKTVISNSTISDSEDTVASSKAIKDLRDEVKGGTEAAIQDALPVGSVILWAFPSNIPTNYIPMDGRQITKGDYPLLTKLITGSDSTSIATMPDWKGRFVRMSSDTVAIGTFQDDMVKAHAHDGTTSVYDHGYISASTFDYGIKHTNAAGGHTPNITFYQASSGGGTYPAGFQNVGAPFTAYGNPVVDHVHSVNIGSHFHFVDVGKHQHTFTTGNYGGTETRPTNVSALYIMKAK